MSFIILKQKDGNLYICAKGESWGYGIVVPPPIWDYVPDSDKPEFYKKTHKEQYKDKYCP